jgi:hypothetical protein
LQSIATYCVATCSSVLCCVATQGHVLQRATMGCNGALQRGLSASPTRAARSTPQVRPRHARTRALAGLRESTGGPSDSRVLRMECCAWCTLEHSGMVCGCTRGAAAALLCDRYASVVCRSPVAPPYRVATCCAGAREISVPNRCAHGAERLATVRRHSACDSTLQCAHPPSRTRKRAPLCVGACASACAHVRVSVHVRVVCARARVRCLRVRLHTSYTPSADRAAACDSSCGCSTVSL